MSSIFGNWKAEVKEILENYKNYVHRPDIPKEFFTRRKRPNEDASDEPQKKRRESQWRREREQLVSKMPRFRTKHLETGGGCTHDVVLPDGMDYAPVPLPPDHKPAKEYPFVLDTFQNEAIMCIENNQSVLVSAHTSAGKTVVAEYAIAKGLKNKQQIIYTAPIKALCNQKYDDLRIEFKDVGLMTGDTSTNITASVLVMTTEILRTLLYKSSNMCRELTWIIFDEVHYMRDKERGVAWEESIIMLLPHMRCVFLSATIPNATQFAEWITFLHKQPCHVVYTDHRPTPLQHYVYPEGGNGIYRVLDEKGNFQDDNFNAAISAMKDAQKCDKDQRGRKGGFKGESNCFKLIKMIMENKYAPVIAFSFSKKDCEAYAVQMCKLDFNTGEEKELIRLVFSASMQLLSEENQKLPQIEQFLPLALKGIGIHHSGLLPIMRELTEILFREGLIKALFTTETFSLGLNTPARTVLFTSTRKFDGNNFRWITSGEYIQMSGRAGRRGLDDKGIVITMIDDKFTPSIGKDMIMGQSDPLNSAYRITYNMLTNTLRRKNTNGKTPEFILENSFLHYQKYLQLVTLYDRAIKSEERYLSYSFENEEEVAEYYFKKQRLQDEEKKMVPFIQKPQNIQKHLIKGRLVKVVFHDKEFGWSPVVGFKMPAWKSKSKEAVSRPTDDHKLDVLLHVRKDSGLNDPSPYVPNERGEGRIVQIKLSSVIAISEVVAKLPTQLVHSDERIAGITILQKILERFPDSPPLLILNIKDEEYINITKNATQIKESIVSHSFETGENFLETLTKFQEREKLYEEQKSLEMELKEMKTILKFDEMRRKKRLIRRLKFIDFTDKVIGKGHALCDISCGDEIVLTELLFDGFFTKMTLEEMCSILSCFVFQEKQKDPPKLTEAMTSLHRQLQDKARHIANESKCVGLDIDLDKYLESFRPDMMGVMYAWASGNSFTKILEMTSIYEGSIVRCIRRLKECLSELTMASRTMGVLDLEHKFIQAGHLITRDIVFTESLHN